MALVVNGEEIDDALVREEAQSLRSRYYEAMGGGDPIALEIQLREWSRENVIERVLLRQEALRDESTIPPEPGEGDVTVQRIERLIDRVTSKAKAPKYREIGDYYKEHREDLWVPETAHCAQILKTIDGNTTEEQALAAIRGAEEQLQAGAAFADVANRESQCHGDGGDIGWFPRGMMVQEFDHVVFSLEPGERSGPFKTEHGFHIVLLIERKPEGIPGLMDIRDQIEDILLRARRIKLLEKYVDDLKARASITGHR